MIKEDFYTGSGYDGLSWWARASGITGSINDHIGATLDKCGYTGSLNDKVTAWGRRLFGDSALTVNDINRKLVEQNFYNSLTFFKDYVNASGLDADFSIGSPIATYTSTSGTPTLDANGYAATTANDDVLSYTILNNRTAAQETIVIKFTPSSDFANDGVERWLTNTDVKGRMFRKSTTGVVLTFRPNLDDSTNCVVNQVTTPLAGVSYVVGSVCSHTSPYAETYFNAVANGTDETVDDFTTNVWGTSFYFGSDRGGNNQLNGSIAWVKIFNRALTAAEVALVV